MFNVNDNVTSNKFGAGYVSEVYWCEDVGHVVVCIFHSSTAKGIIVYYNEEGKGEVDSITKSGN